MNIEFHYYVTCLIALKAGFSCEEACTIAYSSQFVDDNQKQIDVVDERMLTIYRSTPTQVEMLSVGKRRDNILQMHHFLPGDNKAQPLLTTPNSQLAKMAMKGAMNSGNLYLIGIASHAYVDTWAHQNFVGSRSKINSMPGWNCAVIPNIGHADAMDDPDSLDSWWCDARLPNLGVIKNSERFLEAASHLYFYYYKHLNPNKSPECGELLPELARIFKSYRARCRLARSYMMQRRKRLYNQMFVKMVGRNIPQYQENLWRDQILQEVDNASFISGKYHLREGRTLEASDWWQFQEAAKEFQRNLLPVVAARYECIKSF